MLDQFSRTQLLIGKEGSGKLSTSRAAVFGKGGVVGYVCEALVEWTPESLAEQFLRFCADPKNYDEVNAFFDRCKEEGMA